MTSALLCTAHPHYQNRRDQFHNFRERHHGNFGDSGNSGNSSHYDGSFLAVLTHESWHARQRYSRIPCVTPVHSISIEWHPGHCSAGDASILRRPLRLRRRRSPTRRSRFCTGLLVMDTHAQCTLVAIVKKRETRRIQAERSAEPSRFSSRPVIQQQHAWPGGMRRIGNRQSDVTRPARTSGAALCGGELEGGSAHAAGLAATARGALDR